MKLTSLCDYLLARPRWRLMPALLVRLIPNRAALLLPLGALALLLMLWLPAWLWIPLAGSLCFCAALTALQVAYRPVEGLTVSRYPIQQDTKAETVAVDASLLDDGTRVLCAAQPLNPVTEMSLRMGSGALLLGAAMTLLAHEMAPSDRAAVLSAVLSLNIRNDRLRSRSPILQRRQEGPLTPITVQDGARERIYTMGPADAMAAHCRMIWEEQIRPLSAEDHARVLDAARYMETGGCRVLAFATCLSGEDPIFLGLCGLGDGIHQDAAAEVEALRSMGMTVLLRDDGKVPLNMPLLHRQLDVPDVHARPDLIIASGHMPTNSRQLELRPEPGDSLAGCVTALMNHMARLEQRLLRFAELALLPLALCCVAGSRSGVVLITLCLLMAVHFFGISPQVRRLRWPAMAAAAAGCLLGHLFLAAAAPAAAAFPDPAACRCC